LAGAEAVQVVGRIIAALAGVQFPAGTLSVSVGVACETPASPANAGDDADVGARLFRAADRALYQAKARGRNHVCVA
jgi:GGDEF domain-containing protein